MTRNIRPFQLVAGTLGLAVVYVLVLASFDPVDFATGCLIGLAVLLGFRRFVFVLPPAATGVIVRRALWFPPFVLATLREVLIGTWNVSLIVLHIRPLRNPGLVEVPIAGRSPIGVAVSGLAITLSPGSFLVDVDWEDEVMLVHVIDASDPDAIVADIQGFYERIQRHVFP